MAVKKGQSQSTQYRNKNAEENDSYLVEDEEEARRLWKEGKNDLRGFQTAWDNKYIHVKPLKAEIQRMKEVTERPRLVDNKLDKRVSEPNAFSMGRTKEGWVVMEYLITGNSCTLLKSSKPEGKQFAISRLQNMLLESIHNG